RPDVPVRHVRPDAGCVRRDDGPGRVEDPERLPAGRERRQDRQCVGGRSREGLQVRLMASAAAVPPTPATPSAAPPAEGRWRQRAVTAAFLAPALIFLVVWLV